jgi:hypothetical protein
MNYIRGSETQCEVETDEEIAPVHCEEFYMTQVHLKVGGAIFEVLRSCGGTEVDFTIDSDSLKSN